MANQTTLKDLFLSGLSENPNLQLPLFLFFLSMYLLTIIWNLLIIGLIITDAHLHTPMYFFLGNLATLDLCCSSVTVPRILFDLHTKTKIITITACLTQFFFFIFFAASEISLLSVMSYDRYIAICHPLRYMQIIHWKVCIQFTVYVWFIGFTYSLIHTLCSVRLTFCESHIVESFFCDLPQLFQISCSDIYVNVLLILVLGGFVGLGCFAMTILPYVFIIKTLQKMQHKGNKSKVFSTCSSHLSVVFIYYATFFFNYFRPSGSTPFAIDKVVSVFYTVILPLLNPLIYSLRNQDFRTAFRGAMKIVTSSKAEFF
ncbi:olfactory receptor 8G17-like [Hyperolius riggenbachi]|uniref:olfactory receptor 8G17-like n=1 Tax=Hyperolius riggenbachi TaxID=752182 RepID=UPI0035A36A22